MLSESENRFGNSNQLRFKKMMSIEWLGQTVASLCWIISVFTYGIGETGDWLQLGAASSWMLANLFSLVNIGPNTI